MSTELEKSLTLILASMPNRNPTYVDQRHILNIHNSTICNNSKLSTNHVLSLGEWINKLWCIDNVEYYAIIDINGIQPHAIIRIGLINIKLSEVSQTEKRELHNFIYLKYKTVETHPLSRGHKNE